MTGGESDVFSRIAREGAIAMNSQGTSASAEVAELEKLKAVAYVKLGKWQHAMLESTWSARAAATESASRTPGSYSPAPAHSFMFAYPDPVLVRSNSTGSSLLAASKSDGAAAKSLTEILDYYHTATVLDNTYAKAWHEWAMLNAKVCTTWKSIILPPTASGAMPSSSSPGTPASSSSSQAAANPILINHLVSAIRGFFRSISLQPVGDNSLQDILRILALWFEYGGTESDDSPPPPAENGLHGLMPLASPSPPLENAVPSIAHAMSQGFQMISLDNMLAVIPQLLARIHVTAPRVRSLLLLTRIVKRVHRWCWTHSRAIHAIW